MAKCLKLGANRFIGSHLVDTLVEKGHTVKAFDRFGDRPVNFTSDTNVELISGNFLNRSDLANALSDVEYVFHFISTTTPATAENDPLIDIETNIRMSVELLEECVKAQVKKFIFASTGGAIYGDLDSGGPIDESANPQPVSPYAIGKLTIEHYMRYFNRKFGLPVLTYRISNPYGERHSPVNRQGVIPIFLHHIVKDEPITVLGDGTMVRDYLYVKDVADLIGASFESATQPLYNLGSGHGVSVNELVETIRRVTDKELKVENRPKPRTFVQTIVLDTSRFKSEFSLEPKTSLEDGIKKTWEYVTKSQDK
jgi:UDP-glucose 4-epimerase